MDECINRMGSIHTMEYHSATKRTPTTAWVHLEDLVKPGRLRRTDTM